MQEALCVVGSGTTDRAAELADVLPVERALEAAFPGRRLYRAVSSRAVAARMRQRGEAVETAEELFERLAAEGCRDILAVSTHVIPGGGYDKLRRAAGEWKLSDPLVASDEDERWMASLLERMAVAEDCALLAMGHGSEHGADGVYARIQKRLPSGVFVACTMGERAMEAVLPEIEAAGVREIVLMPLMLCAGAHARQLLNGEDSWRSLLESRGISVRVRARGLGALKEVQRRFVEKALRTERGQ